MNHAVVAKNLRKPRILVAPLDWGLGHATRIIPIVRELQLAGVEPWLAGEGAQESLLLQEFPSIPFLKLQGYRIKYTSTGAGMVTQMLIQSPRLLRIIKKENQWLNQMVEKHALDGIISDNRYGLFHAKIPSIIITHQLGIKSPLGTWSERLIQTLNYRYINKFKHCWIPDNEGSNNLAGDLSHPPRMPALPPVYLGPLSRFHKSGAKPAPGHLLFILSGPEPQRSILEEKIIKEIAHYNGNACIVRGLPGDHPMIPSTNMLRFYNHLPARELNDEMEKAEYVISRSGYSTVMDLAMLEKKSILIPTPGQTEQEYLARYLHKIGFAYTIDQPHFSLDYVLRKATEFGYAFPPGLEKNKLEETVGEFVNTCSQSLEFRV
jgi:uncharacterized protein (TIGR00661 family)